MSTSAIHATLIRASTVACAGCASRPTDGHSERYVATYYDRNSDGRVDYEFYDIPGWADDEWALRDTDFNGRYDVRYDMGYPGGQSRVDLRVLTRVRITVRRPPGGFDW